MDDTYRTEPIAMNALRLNDRVKLFNEAWTVTAIDENRTPRVFTLTRANGKRYAMAEEAGKLLPVIVQAS